MTDSDVTRETIYQRATTLLEDTVPAMQYKATITQCTVGYGPASAIITNAPAPLVGWAVGAAIQELCPHWSQKSVFNIIPTNMRVENEGMTLYF